MPAVDDVPEHAGVHGRSMWKAEEALSEVKALLAASPPGRFG
jgi:hypothetical protein